MRISARIFYVLAAWFALVLAGYIAWSLADFGRVEWAGTVMLICALTFALVLALYLNRTQRAVGGMLVEDNSGGDIADGAGEVGDFAPYSWWPIVLAASIALMFLGVAVGIWIAVIAVPVTVIALIGWVYESYRGQNQH